MLGLGLALTNFGSKGGVADSIDTAFTPALITSVKAFWDVSNLSSLFSDRSATPSTPAVVDGVVGTIKDLSSTGAHLIAPTDAARGILRTDGAGKYWIETDGVDDRYVTSQALSALIPASAFEVVFAGRVPVAVDNQRLMDSGAGYWTQPLLRTPATILLGRVYDGVTNKDAPPGGAAYTANTDFVWSSRLDTGNEYGRINNATEGSLACSNIASLASPVGIMADTSGTIGFVNGRFYAAAISNAAVSTADRLSLRTWAGAKSGVSITA